MQKVQNLDIFYFIYRVAALKILLLNNNYGAREEHFRIASFSIIEFLRGPEGLLQSCRCCLLLVLLQVNMV